MNPLFALLMLISLLAAGCGREAPPAEQDGAAATDEFERGPHRGRLLRDGEPGVDAPGGEDVEHEAGRKKRRGDLALVAAVVKL